MPAKTFWSKFAAASAELHRQFHAGDVQEVFEDIEDMLDKCGLPYMFDITADETACHLIFSPEGDPSEAKEIDSVLRAAPAIAQWKFFGRRQQKDLSDVRAFIHELYLLDIERCRFRCRQSGQGVVVEMFIPPCDWSDEEMAGFANTFLWHAIGEDRTMKCQVMGKVAKGTPKGATLSVEDAVAWLLEHCP